ncbi:MAG: hypothetical protein Q9223_007284, partial [Gallowayella weberi]
MTKFGDSEAIGFKRVVARLRRWVQELRVYEDSSPADLKDCIASLSISETKVRFTNVQKADEATFHWLFDPSIVSFSEWLRASVDHPSPVYWIQGKPGSGKSTLMKFAMKDPRTLGFLGRVSNTNPQWTSVAFFFHGRAFLSIQKSLVGMMMEIVDSILRQIPRLIRLAVTVYIDLVRAQRTRAPVWHLEALISLVDRIITQRETRIRLLLFVDALDEHEGDNELLAQLLEGWSQTADGYYVALKICLASRSWPIFTDHFGHCPNFSIHHHTKEDIRLYTESRLYSSLPGPLKLLEPGPLVYLAEQITTKAQGVFIWVRLVVDQLVKSIRDGTPYKTLQRMIVETPEELQDLYEDTLCRIDSRYAKETYVMFQLVLYSIEPLPLDTLVNATESSLDRFFDHKNDEITNASEKSSDKVSVEGLWRWLISRGGGLLEAYTSDAHVDHLGESSSNVYVQFLHQTAKEYIQSPRAEKVMKRVTTEVTNKNGAYFLTLSSQSCFAWIAPIKVHMLYYAKVVEVDNQIDARIELLNFPVPQDSKNDRCGRNWWLEKQDLSKEREFLEKKLDGPLTPYNRILFLVVAKLISMLDEKRISIDELATIRRPTGYTPCLLQVAIGGPDIVPAKLQDRPAMVAKLLSLGYPPDRRTAIKLPEVDVTTTAKTGTRDPTPVEFLLRKFGSVPGSDETRLSILKVLLEGGADHSEPFSDTTRPKYTTAHYTALHHCARFEGAPMISLLFKHGADPGRIDEDDWLPIDYAVLRGDRAVLSVFDEFRPHSQRPHILDVFKQDDSAMWGLLP